MPPNKLEFGRLFGTRAVCESESLHDHIMQRWMFIRTYDVRNGNLFLVVMDNGGSYEFKPVP
jgi:para-nitrobenzyl esterase